MLAAELNRLVTSQTAFVSHQGHKKKVSFLEVVALLMANCDLWSQSQPVAAPFSEAEVGGNVLLHTGGLNNN